MVALIDALAGSVAKAVLLWALYFVGLSGQVRMQQFRCLQSMASFRLFPHVCPCLVQTLVVFPHGSAC